MGEQESAQTFNLGMTINDAMQLHPRAREVFAAFHLGGCAHCAINTVETLEQVCAAYGINPDDLMGALQGLLTEEEASS